MPYSSPSPGAYGVGRFQHWSLANSTSCKVLMFSMLMCTLLTHLPRHRGRLEAAVPQELPSCPAQVVRHPIPPHTHTHHSSGFHRAGFPSEPIRIKRWLTVTLSVWGREGLSSAEIMTGGGWRVCKSRTGVEPGKTRGHLAIEGETEQSICRVRPRPEHKRLKTTVLVFLGESRRREQTPLDRAVSP